MKKNLSFVLSVAFVVISSLCSWWLAAQAPGRINIPFTDAKPILESLRSDVLPEPLRGGTPAQVESMWPDWVSRRDADIRARLASGDEDSVVTFLLFGVTFTKQPRYSFATVAGQAEQGRAEDLVARAPAVQGRIKDLVAATASPGLNERLQFARRVIERHGIDVAAPAGRQQAEQFLTEALRRLLRDYDAYFRDSSLGSTLFRNRGLSSDTSIYAAFAIDAALNDIVSKAALAAGSIRRVAVIGPGLDFTDKQEGYDFYPLQTIQPFAVIDSLRRLNLASPREFQMATYDLNPRVNEHLEAARRRARAGGGYTVQLPRGTTPPWLPDLVSYWKRMGERIGGTVTPIAPPAAVGHVEVRAVRIRSDVVQSIAPSDVDIVLQRPDPLPDDQRFDLVVATNILIYYDVFEQSLALANIAKMLKSGGILLSNNPLFELPPIPIHQIGETKVIYTGGGSDWVAWYRRE